MNHGEYSVKAVKTFVGTDGYGYNAALCRNGKKVAFAVQDGGGGPAMVYWEDREAAREEVKIKNYKGETVPVRVTPEEGLLLRFIGTLPPIPPPEFPDLGPYDVDIELFVEELVNDFDFERRAKRLCKKKTLFRVVGDKAGEWRTLNIPYSNAVRKELGLRYGGKIEEVINERFK